MLFRSARHSRRHRGGDGVSVWQQLSPEDVARYRAVLSDRLDLVPVAERVPVEVRVSDGPLPVVELADLAVAS